MAGFYEHRDAMTEFPPGVDELLRDVHAPWYA
jgi:hypothetical protein